jgi:hypothetical protein
VAGGRADHAGSGQRKSSGGPHLGWFKWYRKIESLKNARMLER